jgi:hypothetical protein
MIKSEIEMEETIKQEENDALVAEAKSLNIPVAEIKTMNRGELRAAIKEEKAKQTTFKKEEGEEDVPEGQQLVKIGGKEFYLDVKKDKEGNIIETSRLYDIATTLGDKFGETWYKNADKEILEELGIESFDDLLADGANDSDIIRSYQAAWNKKYPDDQIDYDGDLGEQTLLTGVDRQNRVSKDESTLLPEVIIEDEKIEQIPKEDLIKLPQTSIEQMPTGPDMQPIQPGPMPEGLIIPDGGDRFVNAALDLLELDIQSIEDYEKAEELLEYNDDTDQWQLKSKSSDFKIDTNPDIGPQTDTTITKDDIFESITGDEDIEEDDDTDKTATVPWQAYGGMAAGLGAGLYSLFHKQPAAQQAGYTQGFTNAIVPERGKAPRLARYDYNQDIANVGADVRAMSKYIETSGGGPANMVNKMMAFSRGQDAKMKIRAAETRANIGVQNTEAQLKQQMTLDNLKRSQNASIFNAQMIRAEAARKDQIDESNTARRQKRQDDMEFQKYAGVSAIADSIQTGFGDILDYKADMAKAQAIGSGAGNVYRDAQLINAGYIYDSNTGQWSKGDKTVGGEEEESMKFGGLRRLQNYKR